jgi:hypothetical protein
MPVERSETGNVSNKGTSPKGGLGGAASLRATPQATETEEAFRPIPSEEQ